MHHWVMSNTIKLDQALQLAAFTLSHFAPCTDCQRSCLVMLHPTCNFAPLVAQHANEGVHPQWPMCTTPHLFDARAATCAPVRHTDNRTTIFISKLKPMQASRTSASTSPITFAGTVCLSRAPHLLAPMPGIQLHPTTSAHTTTSKTQQC